MSCAQPYRTGFTRSGAGTTRSIRRRMKKSSPSWPTSARRCHRRDCRLTIGDQRSKLELDSNLDDAVRRNPEEVRRAPCVPRQKDEEVVAPPRHPDAIVGKERQMREVV